LKALSDGLAEIPVPGAGPPIQTIEDHSDAMGQLLEGLTQHYDSCHHALRSANTDPVSTSALEILARDALQVDDVVTELRDHLIEIEDQVSAVISHVSDLRHIQKQSQHIFTGFQGFTNSHILPSITAIHGFEYQQDSYRNDMNDRLDELDQLNHFYSQFVSAYDAMVIEVGRRKGVKKRMQGIVAEATKKLDALWEEDVLEREEFKKEYGDFLPVDLWPGLGDLPNRMGFVEAEEGHKLPDLGKEVIERAMARRRGDRGGL
jgi:autophagy-related protein 17